MSNQLSLAAKNYEDLRRALGMPINTNDRLQYRRRRRLWKLKKFYVEVFWHHGLGARGIEIQHIESGRWETLISKGTRREAWRGARLIAAKLENPNVTKVIDRLNGKEENFFDSMLKAQQQAAQGIARMQAQGHFVGILKGPASLGRNQQQAVKQQKKNSLIESLLGAHAARLFGGK